MIRANVTCLHICLLLGLLGVKHLGRRLLSVRESAKLSQFVLSNWWDWVFRGGSRGMEVEQTA